ncbi:MAG TPA: xanthine dehydrogenase family protein molybdopterin-binding subunit [Burkholderiales bacterium]|nr:xanthine dehydrogenase family protein molybdopterin-binding subunit [Burkholderiales bacterium]
MYIGQRLPRVEDARLLSGWGRYTDDEARDGQAWCAFVRSPHAHARIVRIDAASASALPGVLAVLTGADYAADGLLPIDHVPNPLDLHDISQRAFDSPRQWPHWPLPADKARHVGEPVAAVIADTPEQARDAADRVEVEYEALPLEERTCLDLTVGDAEAVKRAMGSAAHVVRHRFVHQRVVNCQLEPRSAIGVYDEDGYTLICGSQGALVYKQLLSKVLQTPDVRVVVGDVGGGFGPRNYVHPESVVVLWAAKRVGRPVRWTSTRSEAFLADFQGRDATIAAALAVDGDGRMLAYDAHLRGNVGAHTVSFVPLANFRTILSTVYRVPAISLRLAGVTSNTVPSVPYRGAGRPEAHHVIERLLDLAAQKAGVDRAEIRRRNLIRKGDLPYRSPTRFVLDSADFHAYMDRALAMADYAGFAQRKKAARRPRGIGIANYVESPVGAPRERVELHLSKDRIDIIAGTQSSGQGHETSFAQVAADQLQLPIERIRLRTGDTAFVKAGGGSHSDRSLRFAGTLIVGAGKRLIEMARRAAAEKLEAGLQDVEYADGTFRVAGTDRTVALFELGPLAAEEEFNGRIPASPGGCAVCELEVDPDTGAVDVVRYVTVDDVGQAVNPSIVDGQTHGGIAQGIGQALMEGVALDPAKQVLTGSWMDYGIARADNLPAFETELMEDPTHGNPLRVKGGGEGGVVPATAAVINALCDALGVEDIEMPATPERVWRMLRR